MAYLDRLAACNNADMARYKPLYGRGARIGWVHEENLDLLSRFPDVFSVADRRVDLSLTLYDYDTATAALDGALRQLAADGHIRAWRGERYAVAARFGAEPLMGIERAACALLGIRSWGIHVNGFVRREDGLHLWIAERAHDKPTYPGQLDNTVAGGQPEGMGLFDNLVKECAEEASIGPDLARRAVPVGAVCYRHEAADGLKPDEMFLYDLELPADFTPVPDDGEVEAFHLMPAAQVMEIVRDTDRFKFNCAAVLIHFFIRHGLLDPDTEPDYVALCAGLNQGTLLGP
ncbi:MAG: DUF4743 domain-containing protein [Pseudomonadota bacterium]|nr:DUF4743 domain-containing protein [Pseudomonadota bacterium]